MLSAVLMVANKKNKQKGRVWTEKHLNPLKQCILSPGFVILHYISTFFSFNLFRTKSNIQRYFGTNSVIYSKKGDKSVPNCEISKEMENQQSIKENKKKDLVNIIKGMKVELSTVNVQTTKPPNRGQLKSLEAAIGRLQKSPKDAPQKR